MSVDSAPSWEALAELAKKDLLELEFCGPGFGHVRIWSAAVLRSVLAEVRAVDLDDEDRDIVCRAGVAALLQALRGIT